MYLEVYAVSLSSFYKSQWNFDEAQYYGWSNVAKFNEIVILIQRIIYIFNERIILIQRIIYIFNEKIIFIQPIKYTY